MARAIAIGAILGKGVFKGTTSKNRKAGIGMKPTVSIDEPVLVTSTKAKAEGLETTPS